MLRTPLIRSDSNLYFFAALYFALLDLLPCLQARGNILLEVLLENLQVPLESDIILLVGKYSLF